jgi:hypothetical protein
MHFCTSSWSLEVAQNYSAYLTVLPVEITIFGVLLKAILVSLLIGLNSGTTLVYSTLNRLSVIHPPANITLNYLYFFSDSICPQGAQI